MDELLKEKEKILLKNKYHILRMPNNKMKVEMIEAYYSLLQYYNIISNRYFTNEKFIIDSEFTEKYDRYIINDLSKSLSELENNAEKLCEKYQSIIDAYRDNCFCKYEHIGLNKVNENKMQEAMWYFFDSLGEDVLKIYYNMIASGNIYLNSNLMERMGYAMDSTPIDNACITVQNTPSYLNFYITLAHEIGHCYQFYLQKTQRKYGLLEPYCEITSTLFEKLFVDYLKNIHMLKNDSALNLEDHIILLNNVSISKVLCKLLMENKIEIIDPYNLSYTCEVSEDEIKKEIADNCGYIEPFHYEPELSEIHYSFGGIIAMYFMEKIKNDFDSGWKEFKSFICTVNYLPMEEVIDQYFDIDLIKDKIKKLTKSYQR